MKQNNVYEYPIVKQVRALRKSGMTVSEIVQEISKTRTDFKELLAIEIIEACKIGRKL